MPGGSTLEAIPALRESTPETAIVVLTMQDDPAFAREALQGGALGFVLKEAADERAPRGGPGRGARARATSTRSSALGWPPRRPRPPGRPTGSPTASSRSCG